MSVPRDGCVSGIPIPRKLSVASVMMAVARLMVAITSTGAITLGRMCSKTIAKLLRPVIRAAAT